MTRRARVGHGPGCSASRTNCHDCSPGRGWTSRAARWRRNHGTSSDWPCSPRVAGSAVSAAPNLAGAATGAAGASRFAPVPSRGRAGAWRSDGRWWSGGAERQPRETSWTTNRRTSMRVSRRADGCRCGCWNRVDRSRHWDGCRWWRGCSGGWRDWSVRTEVHRHRGRRQ